MFIHLTGIILFNLTLSDTLKPFSTSTSYSSLVGTWKVPELFSQPPLQLGQGHSTQLCPVSSLRQFAHEFWEKFSLSTGDSRQEESFVLFTGLVGSAYDAGNHFCCLVIMKRNISHPEEGREERWHHWNSPTSWYLREDKNSFSIFQF